MKKGRLGAGAFKVERPWLEGRRGAVSWLTGGGLRPVYTVCCLHMCESVESLACGLLHCPPVQDNNPPLYYVHKEKPASEPLFKISRTWVPREVKRYGVKKERKGSEVMEISFQSCKNKLAFLPCKVCKLWKIKFLLTLVFLNIVCTIFLSSIVNHVWMFICCLSFSFAPSLFI